jgi:hypothetical protein
VEAQTVAQRASDCAVELITHCSQYKVILNGADLETSSSAGNFTHRTSYVKLNRGSWLIPSSTENSDQQHTISFLNIHAGLSVGVMASLDVGTDDRWEHLLLGLPLKGVAIAEESAAKGEILLCPAAHDLLHGSSANPPLIPCNCVQHSSGCWKLSGLEEIMVSARNRAVDLNESPRTINNNNSNINNNNNVTVVDAVQQEIGDDLHAVLQGFQTLTILTTNHDIKLDARSVGKLLTNIQKSFWHWMVNHTHHVVRSVFNFKRVDEISPQGGASSPIAAPSTPTRRNDLLHVKAASFVQRIRAMSRQDATNASQTLPKTKQNGIDIADQREAITIFMNLKFDVEDQWTMEHVLQDQQSSINNIHEHDIVPTEEATRRLMPNFTTSCFNFIQETSQNQQQLATILLKFQQCFEVIVQEFDKAGGQIRQFIVDDKGTVAIGTFGLRGSVSRENSSSAIDTAFRIIDRLNALSVDVSIGIAAG